MEATKVIREDFLLQNGFTKYDHMRSLAQTIGMMKVIVDFHEAAQKTMSEFQGESNIVWKTITRVKQEALEGSGSRAKLPAPPLTRQIAQSFTECVRAAMFRLRRGSVDRL